MIIAPKSRFSLSTAILSIVALFAVAGCYIRLASYYETCDVPYQIMTGWGDFRASVVAPLSAWLTGIVGAPINYDLMPMRYFACTCYVISILIGMIPAWQLSRNINFTLGSGIVALLLFPWFRIMESEYSWDVYSSLLIMAIFSLSISYMQRQTSWKIILAASLAGALIWVRLPSAIMGIVPATAAVYSASGLNKKFLALIYVSSIYSIVAIGLLLALYGSPLAFHEYWVEYKITAHSTKSILFQYTGIFTCLNLLIICFFGIYHVLFHVLSLHKGRGLCLALFFIAAMPIMIAMLKLFFWSTVAPLFITLVMFAIIFTRKAKNNKQTVIGILMLISSFSATFWSNTELARMIIYPFIPVLAWLIIINTDRHQLICITCISLSATIYILFSAIRDSISDGKIWLYTPPENSVVDGNEHINGFFIDEQYRTQYRRVIDNFTPYASNPAYTKAVMRCNDQDFMFEYMFDAKTPVFSNYWDRDTLYYNSAYLKGFSAYIDTLRPPTAILVVHRNMPKPSVAFEYENRYVSVYSDSDFTIVVKPIPGNAH